MTARLYVVMGENNLWDYLVCAQSADAAVNYVIKSSLMELSAKPATTMQVAMFKDNKQAVLLGDAADLAEWQANEKLNENETKLNETNGETK